MSILILGIRNNKENLNQQTNQNNENTRIESITRIIGICRHIRIIRIIRIVSIIRINRIIRISWIIGKIVAVFHSARSIVVEQVSTPTSKRRVSEPDQDGSYQSPGDQGSSPGRSV